MSHRTRLILFGIVGLALAVTIAVREFRSVGRASSVPLVTVLETLLDPIEAGNYRAAYASVAESWGERQTAEEFAAFAEATFSPLGRRSALRRRDARYRNLLGEGRIADASFDADYAGNVVTLRALFVEGDDGRWKISGLEAYGQGTLLGRSVPSDR